MEKMWYWFGDFKFKEKKFMEDGCKKSLDFFFKKVLGLDKKVKELVFMLIMGESKLYFGLGIEFKDWLFG